MYLSATEQELAHFEGEQTQTERRALALEAIREHLTREALQGRCHDWLEYDLTLEPQDKQFGYRVANCLALYGDSAPAVIVRRLAAWRLEAIRDWAKHEAEFEYEREIIREEEDMHAEAYGLPREAA